VVKQASVLVDGVSGIRHIDDAVSTEWPAMQKESASLRATSPALNDALQFTLSLTPKSDGQIVAQREMVAALENALDARRQRFILSGSGVNWIKWTCLFSQAVFLLIAIGIAHIENRVAVASRWPSFLPAWSFRWH
jgi:hypothetical protein